MNQKQFDREEVILHVSDIHAGEVIDIPGNKYNIEIMQARTKYYFDKCLRIMRDIYGRVIPIDTVHLIMTGDMIHNETMRGSAKMAAEGAFTEQIEVVSNTMSENIVRMLDSYRNITSFNVHGVMGNHGRLGRPGDEAIEANFDRQVYDRIKLLVGAATTRRRNLTITWDFPSTSFLVTKVAKRMVVAEHWSQVKCYSGTPYYGLARLRDLRYKSLGGNMDIYLGGHFHREFAEFDGAVETIMCPSMCGPNVFSTGLGWGGMVGQKYYHVHPKHGITVNRTIRMEHIQ